MGKAVTGAFKFVAGAAISVLLPGVGTIIGTALMASGAKDFARGVGLTKKPKASAASANRLQVTFDPGAPRKLVYGRTALATDLRYSGYTGSEQEYYHQILCVASHQVEAIEELWFDSELAWSASGGVAAKFSGYLTVSAKLVGTSGNAVAIDSVWTTAARLTGCAYLHIRYKLTGNSKKAESPFSQQIPSRVTVRGKGALLYDPRYDTTAGGSGSQRVDNQTTWAYTTAAGSGRNPALQLLHYLLGWQINGVLAVGRGFPASRLDITSFVTAANLCDESVTKAIGGTEPRYRFDGIFSEADDPSAVITALCTSMNAVLRDVGGRISLDVLHNDLATPVVSLGADDILGDELWVQTVSLDETPNVIRGRYTDPSDASLYQMVDYPEIRIASPDDIDRIDTFDLPGVQSASQAQRLAKQRLQRAQYQGTYSARMGHRAWQASQGKIVALSHPTLGWGGKKFRTDVHTIDPTGVVQLIIREEHEDIYAWDEEEAPAVEPAEPTTYDPMLSPLVQHLSGVEEDADVTRAVGFGPKVINIEADHLGAITTPLPKVELYKLFKNGVALTSGVTASYRILTGGINGITSASGAQSMSVSSGTASLSVASLQTKETTVEITMAEGVKAATDTVTVRRNDAAPPTSGSSGGGTGGTSASDNSLLPLTTGGTWMVISDELNVTTGSAATSVELAAALSVLTDGTSPTGSFEVEVKWERWNGASWQIVGSSAASNPDAQVVLIDTYYQDNPGSVACNRTEGSLTSATAYKFRMSARQASGTTRTLYFAGTVSAQG